MSERGLPTEGAPACPFVAFEDDRDGRATAPDHRHRCFAEPRPAPRALAHQEAYCLSSAFPVCPTFQDWARREAAAARPASAGQAAVREEPPQSRPLPPLEREPRRTPSEVPAPTDAPRRPPHRDWAAPPPWAGEDAAAAGLAGVAALSAGAAASDAFDDDDDDRYAPPDDDGRHAPPRGDERYVPPRGDERYAPPRDQAPAPVSSARDAGYPTESRGLAGSAAHRLAGPDPDEPIPARPTGANADDDLDGWAAGASGAAVAGSAADSRAAPPPRRHEPAPRRDDRARDRGTPGRGEPTPGRGEPTPRQDPNELFGPAWERPRRYEAYPTLRTRMGIPSLGGLPRVAIWALILMLAALVLFLFGPTLLGIGGDDNGGVGASQTPAATEEVTEEPVATEPPAPTPQVYVVAKGDTMSKIAKKFGVTIENLLAANPQIKNPNKIKIGDEITIPVPVQEGSETGDGGTVEGEASANP